MCLAIPLRVKNIIDTQSAMVEMDGIEKKISIALVPEVKEGQFVVVHVGYALSILDEAEAKKTLETINEIL